MSTELLYTSATQGLRHGSRGFCTVLTTAGMSINVIARLEAISSYRHLFPPDSRQASENPIALSHQRLNLGGQMVSVISRVAAYGTDYSGRTNKIAHHVTIEPNEMPAAGPAWLLRQRSVLRSEWLGQCESPASGPVIPRGDQAPRICSTWKTIAGDAGWGGVVAEAILLGDAQPLWIIYPLSAQTRLLELMDESISLLSAAHRWRATFNTFAANIPPDVECKVRFVPVGTEEARFAASSGKAIDLTKHQSITTASQWVERARGVIRGEPVSPGSRGTFNAVQDEYGDEPVQSAWSSSDDTPPAPPAPTGPPSLPPELIRRDKKRKQLVIAATILGGVFLLGSTWALARHLTGMPIIPGNDASLPPPNSPVAPPTPQKRAPATVPVQTPDVTLDLKLHYDQKQILGWVLEEPMDESPLPNPVLLRGWVRMLPVEAPPEPEDDNDEHLFADQNDQASGSGSARVNQAEPESRSAESNANLVAWGGEAQSFGPKDANFRVETTKLIEEAQTLAVEPFPYSPKSLGGTQLYWSRQTGDLIADAKLDLSNGSGFLAEQASSYRTFAVMLSRIATLVGSIEKENKQLPQLMQNASEGFLSRVRGEKEVLVRSLMRTAGGESGLAEKATNLSESLQAKQKSASKPLKKQQQAALLSVVSDCERIAQASAELRRAYDALGAGQTVEVPDLIFLDSEGVTLRRISLRFHFAW